MTGLLGSDTFVFGNGDGRDVIEDFEDGVDTIAFSGIAAIDSIDDFDILNNGTARVSIRYVDDDGVTNRINIKSDSAFTLDVSDFDFGL